VNLKERLLEIAHSLGIEFVNPDKVISDLIEMRKCTRADLPMWLSTEEAVEYIGAAYGRSISFMGILGTEEATPGLVSTYRRCAWCGKPINGKHFEMHHWLVKRGGLPHKFYAMINVVLNVVPLHHNCHQQYGQTREMRARCLELVTSRFGKDVVQAWHDEISEHTHLHKETLYENNMCSNQE